jgi:hypothetical protein
VEPDCARLDRNFTLTLKYTAIHIVTYMHSCLKVPYVWECDQARDAINMVLSLYLKKFKIPKFKLVESLQSHSILTMSHWSSGLPVCFPSQGTQVQIPWGDLCETGILLLALSR